MTDRRIIKCDYNSDTIQALINAYRQNEPRCINIPRKSSKISLKRSCLGTDFDLENRDNDQVTADSSDKKLVNLGPIALFSEFKLSTSTGKETENIENAHIYCLM